MRAIVVITDSAALPAFERAFLEDGHHDGFTVLPALFGAGRSGVKGGDRVHPGSSSLLFTVVPDERADATLAFLRQIRDEGGARESTRIYVAGVEAAD